MDEENKEYRHNSSPRQYTGMFNNFKVGQNNAKNVLSIAVYTQAAKQNKKRLEAD
jgi:ATP-dependent protease Clp ATPase subunit